MATVLVFIDQPDTSLHKANLELLTLAAKIGEPIVALVGPLEPAVAEVLSDYGVGTVYQPQTTNLDEYLIAPRASYLAAVVQAAAPAAVLLDNTFEGKETAARLGVKISSGVITDVIDVSGAADGELHATKSVLAGSYNVVARVTTGIPVLTVKPNSVAADEITTRSQGAGKPEVLPIEVPAAAAGPAAKVTSREEKPASGRPALTEARIIVSGGRGTNGNFTPIEELADALGGAVGASRAATDAGWIEHTAQVGQTGQTVSPQLYISAGISGAIQQKAGMQTSQVIVAVNKDAESPIFEIADLGIVGDLFEVLPQATEEIRKRKR